MSSLRLLRTSPDAVGHGGDVTACEFTADGEYVLSSGWDGLLRLWDVQQGGEAGGLQASPKPLSACALSPDGKTWVSGSMDGVVAEWEPAAQSQVRQCMAHTRPVSCLRYSPDGNLLATTSWDRNVTVRPTDRPMAGRTLGCHDDIAAGCRFTPDSRRLVSWSYDGSACVWDVARAFRLGEMRSHEDRVTAGDVSADARWFISGGRDHLIKLWDLKHCQEANSVSVGAEVRACLFLLDAESVVIADAEGRLTLHDVPSLEVRSQIHVGQPVQCADLSPAGSRITVGCEDGRLRFVAVEGYDSTPLVIAATQVLRSSAGVLHKLLGMTRTTPVLQCTCPACRNPFELPGAGPGQASLCPSCRRQVRIALVMQPPEPVLI